MAFEIGSSSSNKVVNDKMTAEKEASALIVDDDVFVRKINTIVLTNHGFKVSTVDDGIKVVDMYKAGEGSHFNLITMDLEMPFMNGIEATKALRTMGVKCKIIGVTASDNASQKQTFMEAGLDYLFDKPLNAEKLASCFESK